MTDFEEGSYDWKNSQDLEKSKNLEHLRNGIPLSKHKYFKVVDFNYLNGADNVVNTRFGTVRIFNVIQSKNDNYYYYDYTILSFSKKLRGFLKVDKDGKVWICYGNPKIPFKKYFYTRLYCQTKMWVPVSLPVNDLNFSKLNTKVEYICPHLEERFTKVLITELQSCIFDKNMKSYDIVLRMVSSDKKTATVNVIVGTEEFPLFKDYISEDEVDKFIDNVNKLISFQSELFINIINNLPKVIH
jgi:hypothetical protein